jgi:hypothetical protein
VNLVLFGVVEYFKWGLNINEKYLFVLSIFIYTIMTIILIILLTKGIVKINIIENIIGIVVLYLIILTLLAFISLFLQSRLQYNLNKHILDRIIKVLQLIIINIYTFSIIVYMGNKKENIKLN